MKKLLFLNILLILSACSGGDDDSLSNQLENVLIGTWTIQSHVVNGQSWILNSCDLQESYTVAQTTMTHREYEDIQCNHTDCLRIPCESLLFEQQYNFLASHNYLISMIDR